MRDISVGNGTLSVNFDDKYQIRDIFFPHVGQENHTVGFPFRFGVWVNGEFSWTFDNNWRRELRYLPETLVTYTILTNETIGIELVFNDTVASHENVFIRRIAVKNLRGTEADIRIFQHQDFRIYENNVGDTAFYDPETHSIIHYKKHRFFLIGTFPRFDSFATGRKGFGTQEGTWRDAEDGELHGGTITEGSVDSTIGMNLRIGSQETAELFYWIGAGMNYREAVELNRTILERGPAAYLDYTKNYWRVWVNRRDDDLGHLPQKVVDLYKRSLLIIRTQTDHEGAIVASNDSDVTARATDHYAYLWTRDGAFIANSLDLAGFSHLTRKFFDMCRRIVGENGYFFQKYNPDGTVASGWHSLWDPLRGERLVPIQEDETALVLWALWEHYDLYRDIEFAHSVYRKLTLNCGNFLTRFRDPITKLPEAGWNLWEDRRGVHTFTCATVVAGLRGAAKFARLFDEKETAERFEKAADEVCSAMSKYLYSEELGRFYRSAHFMDDGTMVPDSTIDASLFGIFYFGCYSPDDPMVIGTMNAIEEKLGVGGGIARFESDGYMRTSDDVTGNPWFICTLWLAEYHIARAQTLEDLKKPLEILEWVESAALPSGILGEQFDPATGFHLSVSPLTWSHSTFVSTVLSYQKKAESLTKQ